MWVIRRCSEKCQQQPEQLAVCECRDGAWRAAQALRSTAGCEPERAVTLSRRRESRHEEKQTEFLESVIEVIAECVGGRRACPRECA
mmetsp:Transcript_103195/g.277252  ORF Transcript_103195/g.277252 Transcript_103195/m.277252 type:complete len:87 (+) Transcript_103195:335-595(+)